MPEHFPDNVLKPRPGRAFMNRSSAIKTKRLALFIFLYLIAFTYRASASFNQYPGKTYKSEGFQVGLAGVEAHDGGYVIIGRKETEKGFIPGAAEMLRIDAQGNLLWRKAINEEHGTRIVSFIKTSDGGYIGAGFFADTSAHEECWVVKFNATLDMEWEKTYGEYDCATAKTILEHRNGGFLIAGNDDLSWESTTIPILKINHAGSVEWEKQIKGSHYKQTADMVQDKHGNILLLAERGPEYSDLWLIKMDPTGNVVWQSSYGKAGNEIAIDIALSADGGYVVLGETISSDEDAVICIVKFDPSGGIEWQKIFNKSDFQNFDRLTPVGIVSHADSSFTMLVNDNYVEHVIYRSNVLFLHLDQRGNIKNIRYFNNIHCFSARSFTALSDGGYLAAGMSSEFLDLDSTFDAWAMKIDSGLNSEWTTSVAGYMPLRLLDILMMDLEKDLKDSPVRSDLQYWSLSIFAFFFLIFLIKLFIYQRNRTTT